MGGVAIALMAGSSVLFWLGSWRWTRTPPRLVEADGGVMLVVAWSRRLVLAAAGVGFAVAAALFAVLVWRDPGALPTYRGRSGLLVMVPTILLSTAYALQMLVRGTDRLQLDPEAVTVRRIWRRAVRVRWRDIGRVEIERRRVRILRRAGGSVTTAPPGGLSAGDTADLIGYCARTATARRDLGTAAGVSGILERRAGRPRK